MNEEYRWIYMHFHMNLDQQGPDPINHVPLAKDIRMQGSIGLRHGSTSLTMHFHEWGPWAEEHVLHLSIAERTQAWFRSRMLRETEGNRFTVSCHSLEKPSRDNFKLLPVILTLLPFIEKVMLSPTTVRAAWRRVLAKVRADLSLTSWWVWTCFFSTILRQTR